MNDKAIEGLQGHLILPSSKNTSLLHSGEWGT